MVASEGGWLLCFFFDMSLLRVYSCCLYFLPDQDRIDFYYKSFAYQLGTLFMTFLCYSVRSHLVYKELFVRKLVSLFVSVWVYPFVADPTSMSYMKCIHINAC